MDDEERGGRLLQLIFRLRLTEKGFMRQLSFPRPDRSRQVREAFSITGVLSSCFARLDAIRLGFIVLAAAIAVGGCSGGGGGSDSRLRLISFNLEGVADAFLNERLVFLFNAPVDPASVDVNTLQIRFDASQLDIDGDCFADETANTDAIVEGEFIVEDNRVIFQPQIPVDNDHDVGLFPAHRIASDPRPEACDRDTPLVLVYRVFLPGFSEDFRVTLRSKNDRKPLVESYSTTFSTVEDLAFPPLISPSSFTDPVRGAPYFEELVFPADGASGVSRNAVVVARFSEAFVPSSITATSLFLSAFGPNTGREQTVPSTFDIDPVAREIRLVPTVGLPAGVEVALRFTSDLIDFGGNPLEVPPGSEFPSFRTVDAPTSGPFFEREDFSDISQANLTETSALWNPPSARGWLVGTNGGGIASHGELILDPVGQQTYEFDTGSYDPANPLPSFDYSRIFIGQRATLRATGDNPLILKSIGDITIDGTIDVSGIDARDVSAGATVATGGGAPGAGGGAGGRGGSGDGDDGAAGLGARVLGTLLRSPGGGGGSIARTCAQGGETGGAGGGEFAGSAEAGKGDAGNGNGGAAPGMTYGARSMNPFLGTLFGGSGGGGGGGTCVNGTEYPGSGGGGGGGLLWLHALGDVLIRGEVLVNGGEGGDNLSNNGGAAGGTTGGGGSGGGILIQGIEGVQNTGQSSIEAKKAPGGQPSEGGGANNGRGGGGGNGRIRVEAADENDLVLTNLAFDPTPRRGTYDRGGLDSGGTSVWFDTGAFFPDFSFTIGSRNGGAGDQDNANLFPDPSKAVQYLFQGASTDPDNPFRPNMNDLRPGPGLFTPNIDEVDDSRFIRVKVKLAFPYPDIGVEPRSSFFEFRYTYSGEAVF